MRLVVLIALYAVMVGAALYAVLAAYSLVSLWGVKLQVGTAFPNLAQIGAAIVFGIGLPYCMTRYLRKQ